MTPREFMVYLDEKVKTASEDVYDRFDIQMINAYYSAYFNRTKKMENINKFLSRRDSKKKIKQEELYIKLKNFAASFKK